MSKLRWVDRMEGGGDRALDAVDVALEMGDLLGITLKNDEVFALATKIRAFGAEVARAAADIARSETWRNTHAEAARLNIIGQLLSLAAQLEKEKTP